MRRSRRKSTLKSCPACPLSPQLKAYTKETHYKIHVPRLVTKTLYGNKYQVTVAFEPPAKYSNVSDKMLYANAVDDAVLYQDEYHRDAIVVDTGVPGYFAGVKLKGKRFKVYYL